jgi:hypothetical protein
VMRRMYMLIYSMTGFQNGISLMINDYRVR